MSIKKTIINKVLSVIILLGMLHIYGNPIQDNTNTETVAIAFMIDNSLSMKSSDPKGIRFNALDNLILSNDYHYELASALFNDKVEILKPFFIPNDNEKKEFAEELRIKGSHLGYYTDTHDALEAALGLFQKVSANNQLKILFLLSDGKINVSEGDSEEIRKLSDISNRLQHLYIDNNIKIISLALSNDSDTLLLKNLSLKSEGKYYFAKNADSLISCVLKIKNDLNHMERLARENRLIAEAKNISLYRGINDAKLFLINNTKNLNSLKLNNELAKYNSSSPRTYFSAIILFFLILFLIILFLYIKLKRAYTNFEKKIDALLENHKLRPIIQETKSKTKNVSNPVSDIFEKNENKPDKIDKNNPPFIRSIDLDDDSFIEIESRVTDIDKLKPIDKPVNIFNNNKENTLKCFIHPEHTAHSTCIICHKNYCKICNLDNKENFVCSDCQNKEDTKKMLGII